MSQEPGSRAQKQWSADGQWWWNGEKWLPASEVRASSGRIQNTKAWPWMVIGLILAVGVVVTLVIQHSGFDVKVTKWSPGSSSVSGSIQNNTGTGCTDPEITLHFRDHNDAIVQEFSFGAGDLPAGSLRNWTTHLVGLLFTDSPVPSTATSVTADATCADKH